MLKVLVKVSSFKVGFFENFRTFRTFSTSQNARRTSNVVQLESRDAKVWLECEPSGKVYLIKLQTNCPKLNNQSSVAHIFSTKLIMQRKNI